MSQPLVSVIIPVHNRPWHLRRAIASVQAQTTDDWELVVCDDASTDETPQVAMELAREDARIRLVRHAENQGANTARNTAAREALGEWLSPLDSDDEYAPTRLEKLLAAARDHEASTGRAPAVVTSRYLRHRIDGTAEEMGEPRSGNVHAHLLMHFFGITSSLLIRRDAFAEAGGFDESFIHSGQEYDLLLRLAKAHDFAAAQECLVTVHRDAPFHAHELALGHELVYKRHAADLIRHWGRKGLAFKWLAAGLDAEEAGRGRRAAALYVQSLRACPWFLGSWRHLLTLPLRRRAIARNAARLSSRIASAAPTQRLPPDQPA